MFKKCLQKNTGFTLIESLVAIAILLIAITGPLSIVASSIAQANYAKQQIISYYLAQEAIEGVRNIRENNLINARPWLSGLSNCTNGCAIETTEIPIQDPVACATINSDECRLYIQTTGSGDTKLDVYTHKTTVGNVQSLFKRRLVVTPFGDEAEVAVEIEWALPAGLGILGNRNFIIKERIYDW